MSKTPEWKLTAFDWLPMKRWTVETIFNLKEVYGKKYCKICDQTVPVDELEKHLRFHKKEYKIILDRIRAENAEKAKQERIFRAQEKKRLREIEKGG